MGTTTDAQATKHEMLQGAQDVRGLEAVHR